MQLIRTITGAALLLAAGTSAWAATDYNRPPQATRNTGSA